MLGAVSDRRRVSWAKIATPKLTCRTAREPADSLLHLPAASPPARICPGGSWIPSGSWIPGHEHAHLPFRQQPNPGIGLLARGSCLHRRALFSRRRSGVPDRHFVRPHLRALLAAQHRLVLCLAAGAAEAVVAVF